MKSVIETGYRKLDCTLGGQRDSAVGVRHTGVRHDAEQVFLISSHLR
jgi:hypothetical protein